MEFSPEFLQFFGDLLKEKASFYKVLNALVKLEADEKADEADYAFNVFKSLQINALAQKGVWVRLVPGVYKADNAFLYYIGNLRVRSSRLVFSPHQRLV